MLRQTPSTRGSANAVGNSQSLESMYAVSLGPRFTHTVHVRPHRWLWLLSTLVAPLHAGRAQPAAPAAIVGKWAGIAGPPQDRIPIAFEFRPNAKGELTAYYYAFVYNATDIGVLTPTADGYEAKGAGLTLVLKGDSITGTMFSAPLVVRRTDTLPRPQELPALPVGPGPVWSTSLGGAIHAPAAVRDSTAYVGTTGGMFYALRLSDGAFAWAFAAGRPIFGGAATTENAVYFTCDDGFLYKLDRQSGKELWKYDLGDQRATRILIHQVIENSGEFDFDDGGPTPIIDHGVIYVGSGDGSMHAVDAEKGTRIWRFEGKGKARTTAALDGTRVIFGTFGNMVYAVDRVTGTELWKRDTRAPLVSAPAIIQDRVVFGNRGGMLGALSVTTGEVVWRLLLWGSSAESEAAPADGSRFFFGSSDLRRLQYIDAADGRVIWRSDVYGWAWPRPLPTRDRVFMSTVGVNPYEFKQLGAFTALDRATGRIIWRWPAPSAPGIHASGFRASPVASGDGRLILVGGLDGTMYAFPGT